MRFIWFCLVFLAGITFFQCTGIQEFKTLEVAGVEQPEFLLNGTWKFSLDQPDNFWENHVDFTKWADIQVPGECQMQGFAIKHDQPYVYKHRFPVPSDYGGKQILLNFHGVYSYAKVWLNGTFIREHYGGFTRWTCDITSHVEPGKEAILTVEFTDLTDDISYGSGYAKHQIGGILRDVELVAMPKQHFRQLYFETDLDEDYQHADLMVFYELAQNKPTNIKVELLSSDLNLIVSKEETVNTPAGSITIPVKDPIKWDAEHPNLYIVRTALINEGKPIMSVSRKIGFREVVVEGNRLLVNGKQVKLRGACRHDIHPLLGRMTNPEYDKRDVLLAKEANMNFIRTSHYPPSEKFLEYCDKYGIYVEDETAVCFVGSHRTRAYQASGATQSDPKFTKRYLTQLEEMVQNHRSHPSVIIWSIGNENVFGSNFVESYQWIKARDSTRPVIYSYPGTVPDSLKIFDLVSMHYPDWKGNLHQYGITTSGFEYESMPMLFDEWAHVACYNNFELKEDPNVRNFWGQSLDSMWTYTFESDGGLGGAIWCMIDETFMLPQHLDGFNNWWGILDPNVIPATYVGPCVGYGEWGILDTWRRKKPEFWLTKKAYSPVKIYEKQLSRFESGKEMSIPIHNRFDHTDFKEIKVVWRYGSETGEVEDTALKPHQKGQIVIPPKDWKSNTTLTLTFFVQDTFLVDEYNLLLGEKKVELPSIISGDYMVKESDDRITLSADGLALSMDNKTGLLNDIMLDDEILITSGPHIHLKIPGKRVQYSTIEMEDYAKNWVCKKFGFSVKDGVAEVHTEGKYDSISAKFDIQFGGDGVFKINYEIENVPGGKMMQEVGIKFIVTDRFERIAWDKTSYFTAYPGNHLGSPAGDVDINIKPEITYRKKPNHSWEMDSKGFYYFGLNEQMPYTNIVRSLKEGIFSYALNTLSSKLEIHSNGHQACRLDKINGENTLIINDQWDYNSLLWGNYMKRIPAKNNFSGQVLFTVERWYH